MYSRPWPLPPSGSTTLHHITDSHMGYSDPFGNPVSWVDGKLAAVARDVHSAFVHGVDGMVHTGDIADDGGGATTQTGSQDSRTLDWLNSLRQDIPSVWCIGNHDLNDRTTNLGPYSPNSRLAWERVYGREAVGITDMGDVSVMYIAPDSYVNGDPWLISPATLDWMDSALAAASKPVILACHFPLAELDDQNGIGGDGGTKPEADISDLIGSHSNVAGMVSGHKHLGTSSVRMVDVLSVGGRDIIHICGPSVSLTEGIAGNTPYAEAAKTAQWSLYLSIADPTHWEVRYRTHTPARWGDVNGWRVTTVDSATGTVTQSQGEG